MTFEEIEEAASLCRRLAATREYRRLLSEEPRYFRLYVANDGQKEVEVDAVFAHDLGQSILRTLATTETRLCRRLEELGAYPSTVPEWDCRMNRYRGVAGH